jgi:hypothetical protein
LKIIIEIGSPVVTIFFEERERLIPASIINVAAAFPCRKKNIWFIHSGNIIVS